ncbi:hypothetical protein Trydic_g10936 [Trypoxylus dichotomus]
MTDIPEITLKPRTVRMRSVRKNTVLLSRRIIFLGYSAEDVRWLRNTESAEASESRVRKRRQQPRRNKSLVYGNEKQEREAFSRFQGYPYEKPAFVRVRVARLSHDRKPGEEDKGMDAVRVRGFRSSTRMQYIASTLRASVCTLGVFSHGTEYRNEI